jgi:hypothetical protein
MECQSDGLCTGRLQAELGALDGDTGTNEVGKGCELSAYQMLTLDPLPFALPI